MEIIKFSPSGEYLAVGGSDGHLRVWETVTNKLWHEFIPSSHLAAMCTCIEWAPTYQENAQEKKGKKKKKRRVVEGDVIVMGTAVGSLLFYDVTKSQTLTQSNRTSAGSVNALAWSPVTLSVYTCGSDGIIREWDPENATIISHWTASKENLTAVATINENLLVAGQTITLWDLNSKKAISTFTGHPGQISQLEVVPKTDYFVSMSQGDRHLKIWQKAQSNAVASLAVPEPSTNFHVFASDNGTAYVSVTNKKGQLQIFQQKLNGQVKKPLTPVATIKILESCDESVVVPILAGHLSDASNISVTAAFGNWLQLRFEKFDFSSLSKEHVISREFLRVKSSSSGKSKSKKASKSNSDSLSTTNHVEVPNDVKHLQPGMESIHQVPVKKGGKKGQEEVVEEGDLPMEERLTNLTIDAPVRNDLPQGENLGHLLSQGLHSKDTRILQSVLHRHDEKIILNTIRSFPVQLIIPLIEEIKVMLSGKSQLNHSTLRWLKAIFQIHSSYLMCCSANEELMGPILSLLRARETLYPQMCLLKGKLELVKGHVGAKQFKADMPNDALLTYQDESSDDEDKNEDGLLPSESEDLLTSDDLDVDGENSGSEDDDDDESDDDDEKNEGSSDNDDDDDDDNEEIKGAPKLNGNSVAHGHGSESDEESMDED